MAKDTINVNMNVYDIPILVEQLNKLEQENKQLKEELEKKNKKYWQQQCAYYSSILYSLEEWLNKEKGYYLCGRNNGKTLLYGKELKRIETIDKIQELRKKYE